MSDYHVDGTRARVSGALYEPTVPGATAATSAAMRIELRRWALEMVTGRSDDWSVADAIRDAAALVAWVEGRDEP
jgi:hypothetical protein